MRFDVKAIAQQVANKVIGRVDADTMAFVNLNRDFKDAEWQEQIVEEELVWILDKGLPENILHEMIEHVVNHPDMQLAFDAADRMVQEARREVDMWEQEARAADKEYRQSVL